MSKVKRAWKNPLRLMRRPSPALSVVVAFRNMAREAPRTLYTLSAQYQIGVRVEDYEVVAVDAGSTTPMDPKLVQSFGSNFRLVQAPDDPSPARAINRAAIEARGRAVAVTIDGARMLSPGVIQHTLRALKAFDNPVVATLAWHLGHKPQNHAMQDGYDQVAEDKLLNSVNWRSDGYELFNIACLAVRRSAWNQLGGLNEQFKTPGGGYVNLDFYREACEKLNELVLLLGEGTFHQFHGGVATNVPIACHPGKTFREEYRKIRGREFENPRTKAQFIGHLPAQAHRFMAWSLEQAGCG